MISIARTVLYGLTIGALLLTLNSCQEDDLVSDRSGPTKTFDPPRKNPGDLADPSGPPRYPYPQIIEREYIPRYSRFAHTKSLTWRIAWPAYDEEVDASEIPTVFTLPHGALNSFNYLNGIDKQNTYNANFSLFYNDRVETAYNLWDELNIPLGDGLDMQTTHFAKSDQSVEDIEYFVKERPSLFESYWPGSEGTELDYEEGDIIFFWLSDEDLYGGIRIVSMAPRIIEVYLAVPNE